MRDRICDQLDDYLGGWLEDSARPEFEAHLKRCADCRQEAERQRQLDALLAQAGAHLESVPPVLVERIEQRLAKAQWRRRVVRTAAGLAAAAVLLLSVVLWPDPSGSDRTEPIAEAPPESGTPTVEQPPFAPTPGRAASQQLALLVASHCQGSCPSAHRWIRLPHIPPPTGPVHRRFTVTRRGGGDEEAKPADDREEPPSIVLSASPRNISCVQSRQTLGARRLASIVFQ